MPSNGKGLWPHSHGVLGHCRLPISPRIQAAHLPSTALSPASLLFSHRGFLPPAWTLFPAPVSPSPPLFTLCTCCSYPLNIPCPGVPHPSSLTVFPVWTLLPTPCLPIPHPILPPSQHASAPHLVAAHLSTLNQKSTFSGNSTSCPDLGDKRLISLMVLSFSSLLLWGSSFNTCIFL